MLPRDVRSWVFVTIQAILLGLLIFLPGALPMPGWAHTLSLVLELAGAIILIISIWNLRHALTVFPTPIPSGKLSTDGLYRYMRHPMYTGVLALSLGMAAGSGQLIKYGLVAALYVLFFYKSRYEEVLLARKYPEYASYQANTPRFVPFLAPPRAS